MQTGKIVTSGLVLRETDTKEADKILTVLTPELGKISVIARGARRKNSRLAASAQWLVYSEMTLYLRGNWYMLDEAGTIELFDGMRADFEKIALASCFAELAETLVMENSPEILRLLLNALYALSVLDRPNRLVKAAFTLRLLALAGFEPLADGCAFCGRPQPHKPMLDVMQGVVHCAGCKKPGKGFSLPLTQDTLEALQHILYCDPKRLYSFTLPEQVLQQLDHVVEEFLFAQLERNFRSLDYYKSIVEQGNHL